MALLLDEIQRGRALGPQRGYFNVNAMIFMDVSKDNSKNLIIGNIFDSTDSIKLGAYTEGWFIMGNQLSTVTDQGTNNIIRFNSNDRPSRSRWFPAGRSRRRWPYRIPLGRSPPSRGKSG